MDFTFAELLRSFRERASLDQAALAAGLGVHRNTVSAWERGQYRPHDRELVLRVAEELALVASETDHLLCAADFPPMHGNLAELAARHQLRPPVADFVGRVIETTQLVCAFQAACARGGRATVGGIRGMGGIGKTELAYRVAHQLRETFPDAQIVLDLRGSSGVPLTSAQALQAVIRAFTHDEKLPDDLHTLQPLYRSVLHGQRALVVADDARDAAQVRPLLPPHGCGLLVTSRHRFTLPGMTSVDLDQLSEAEAVTFLRGSCDFLSPVDAQTIAGACGNLPLALRVSGGILRNDPALSVADYIRQLADTRLLLRQLRDPDDRQLDVAASLELSYTLLDPTAQGVFRQLAVLSADFAMPLAHAVVEAPGNLDVEATLHLLLRRNLLLYDTQRQRWRLHDLVRVLALSYLEAAGELEAAWWRYARAGLKIAKLAGEQFLRGGEAVAAALDQFDAEWPHIHAARCWAAAHSGTLEADSLLLEDALATTHIGELRYDQQRERIPQLERASAAAQRLGARRDEGRVLNNLGRIYGQVGDARKAITCFEQALAIAHEVGDRRDEGAALSSLGMAYYVLGDVAQAIVYYERHLAIAREIGNQRGEGQALNNLGLAYGQLGQAWQARRYFEAALAIAQVIGSRHREGMVLANLVQIYVALGDARLAIEAGERSLDIARDLRDRCQEGGSLASLGLAYLALGELARAASAFAQALAILREIGDRAGEAECNWQFGLALAQQGEHERALPLLRACLVYEVEVGHARAAEHAALLTRIEAGQERSV
jgi:tetratricopeptide (TPR) repeat protein/transcriptional regulator with XRE-family HTH domain